MPVAFRCQHCNQLMSISRKKAGELTICARCGQETLVPRLEPVTPLPVAGPAVVEATEAAAIDQTSPVPVSFKPHAAPTLAAAQTLAEESEEEFQFQRGRSALEEMDLTPMVDVTFLLLIFFMVTASFSLQKSLEVPPPDPDNQGAAQTVVPLEDLTEQAILIEIDADNQYRVETEVVADPFDLPTALAQARTLQQKNEVIITAHELTRHEAVVTAIDAAQEVGMQRIRWTVKGER